MASSSLPSIDELDARIRHHLEETAGLRRLRNSHPLINRLPTEILAHIFSFCGSSIDWQVHYHSLAFTHFNKLTTQVCHLWREVALSSPCLWALVPCGQDLNRLEQVMKRSKNAPLAVNLSRYQQGDVEGIMKIICRNMSRIQHLRIEYTRPIISTMMRNYASTLPCSLLTSLDLEVTSAHYYRDRETTLPNLPASPSCIEAPCLRTLRLVGCTEYINYLPLAGLRSLCLEQGTGLKAPARLLQMLANMRELRSLKVVGMGAIEAEDSVVRTDTPVILFPFLTRLRLEGQFKTTSLYVQHCIAPALSHMQLHFSSTNGVNLTAIRDIPLITTFTDKWMQQPKSVTLMEENKGLNLACRKVDAAELHTDIGEDAPENLQLILSFPGVPSHTQPAMHLASDILQLCSTMCIVRLDISTMSSLELTKDTWLQIFPLATATSVQHLDVTESSTQGLIDALGASQKGPGRRRGKKREQHFLPSLSYIRFVNVDFTMTFTRKKTLGEQLKLRLKARASQRLKLSTLDIETCQGYTEEDLDEIETNNWVDCLTWDGDDGDDDESESGYGGHGFYCDCGDIHDFEDSDYFGSDVDGAYFL